MEYYQEVFQKIYDMVKLYYEKQTLLLEQALEDADKMLTAQQGVAGEIGLAPAKFPEDKFLEDPGLATRSARQDKVLTHSNREWKHAQEKERFQDACKALNQDSYVDNLFSGKETA